MGPSLLVLPLLGLGGITERQRSDNWPTQCVAPDGRSAPCGPAAQQCGRPLDPDGTSGPRFHVLDSSCGINDPNGPFQWRGLFHLFYQDHLAIPNDGIGIGPVWGHVVSRDLATWARLPVALWNDEWYDGRAVFTGSTTIVPGRGPVIIYPGLCNSSNPPCQGATYAAATPTDPTGDPLLANWTKSPGNPILNGTADDPSTAWRTAAGEWRLIGNSGARGQRTKGVAPVFATSGDPLHGPWRFVGDSGFPAGECPSLFPLPRLTNGTSAPAGEALPTHVYHRGWDRADWMQLGTHKDGGPNQVGTWNATPGVSFAEFRSDIGNLYAVKDFADASGRRIMWGWITASPACISLPREITYHPRLKQLVFSPVRSTTKTSLLFLRSPVPISSGLLLGAGTRAVQAAAGPGARAIFGSRAPRKRLSQPRLRLGRRGGQC